MVPWEFRAITGVRDHITTSTWVFMYVMAKVIIGLSKRRNHVMKHFLPSSFHENLQ